MRVPDGDLTRRLVAHRQEPPVGVPVDPVAVAGDSAIRHYLARLGVDRPPAGPRTLRQQRPPRVPARAAHRVLVRKPLQLTPELQVMNPDLMGPYICNHTSTAVGAELPETLGCDQH